MRFYISALMCLGFISNLPVYSEDSDDDEELRPENRKPINNRPDTSDQEKERKNMVLALLLAQELGVHLGFIETVRQDLHQASLRRND